MKAYLKTLNWVVKLQAKRTTVGRHKDADLCLQNGGVDEHHATIEWNEGEHCYVLSDLNSVHGTYVNDCRIHNAAVRLTPGDELHFGYGGSTYKLLLETADPLPILPAQSTAPPAQVRSHARSPPVTPRPPGRPRPASAGAKRSSLGPKASELWGRSHRAGGWTSSTGRGLSLRNVSSSQSSRSMQDLLQDKEESWVRRGEELSGVIVYEGEGQRKECVMAALRDEVSALRLQLSQSSQSAQSDLDIRNKLNSLARDIQEKKEEIQHLKEQMMEMQKNSGELVAQSVAEREQRISSLRAQLANLKSENSKCTALANSLQKDLLSREKQTLKLAAEVDKLRQDVRYKDAQLSNMANKMKESEKIQEEFHAREKEVESLRKTVERLEGTLRENQKKLKQQNTEGDVLKHRLEQMMQEQASLQTETGRMKLLQQQTLQREEKAQTELRHTQTRLVNLCSQITKRILLTSETVSEQEVLERLSELAEQKEEFRIRVQKLEQKLQEHTENQRVVEEDTEKLKARLTEWQSHAQKVCIVDAIQSQISALQDEKVCPAVSWVQTHTLSVLSSLHKQLQDTASRLLAAGMELSENTGGVSGAIQALCQQHQESQAELKSLKAEKQQLEEREALAGDLQDRLEAMRQELEHQKLQVTERQAEMESTVKLQLEKMKTDLESARKAEAALHLEMEMQEKEWCNKLEEAEKRESELRERIRAGEQQDEHWRERMKEVEDREEEWGKQVKEALQRGAEEERERTRVEIEEYREQVRQHAYTIVAMEKQVSTAQQRKIEMQEERDSLMQQLTEALSRLEVDKTSVSPEQQQLEQTVTSLRASLGASQQEVVKQGEVITSLSRDLAHAHACLSDLTGELSEQQKMELETHRALVVEQRMQLSTVTQKLTMTSQLLEQKDEELKALREKLNQMEADFKSKTEGQEDTSLVPLLTNQHTKDVAIMVSPSHMTTQGSVGKGHRHEEMLHQQKKTLAEMRARIRAVEHKWPSKLLGQQGEPVKQSQMKTHRPQRSAIRRESISSVVQSGFAFPEALSEAALERTARLDMSDTLELSERTYVDLARALCEALELSEGQLSGCVPIKHVPPAERKRLASLRQDDLELFRNRLALQNSQSQTTHLLLQQSQTEIHTLRESLTVGQQLQAELDSVRAELEGGKQENDALRQALQLAQTQLQYQRDQHCPKSRKALNMEGIEGRSGRIGHHNCVPNDNYDKVSVPKRRQQQQERRRRRETEVDVLKSEPGHKEQAACKVATQLASVPQQQRHMALTEAH